MISSKGISIQNVVELGARWEEERRDGGLRFEERRCRAHKVRIGLSFAGSFNADEFLLSLGSHLGMIDGRMGKVGGKRAGLEENKGGGGRGCMEAGIETTADQGELGCFRPFSSRFPNRFAAKLFLEGRNLSSYRPTGERAPSLKGTDLKTRRVRLFRSRFPASSLHWKRSDLPSYQKCNFPLRSSLCFPPFSLRESRSVTTC